MTMSETMTTNQRTAENLHDAAVLLAEHPDIPTPYITSHSDGTLSLAWFFTLDHMRGDLDQRTAAQIVVKAIDGGWKRGESAAADKDATWTQQRGDLSLLVQVSRDTVCERIVVGTETVTVPAVEAEPERIEERDVVEWRCQPLLAEDEASHAGITFVAQLPVAEVR